MLAITCALPDESRQLLHSFQHKGMTGPLGVSATLGNIGPHEAVLFLTGMGEGRVRQRLGLFLESYRVSYLLSMGYAGGLSPQLSSGALFLAQNYSSPALLHAAQGILGGRATTGQLVTTSHAVETLGEKAALAAESGADAVDMETAAIAALCHAHSVPMLSLRGISDTATEELPVPFSVCFDAETERPKVGSLLGYLARHPKRLRGFLRFVDEMARVRTSLAGAVRDLVEQMPL